jgi:hypothetical protein
LDPVAVQGVPLELRGPMRDLRWLPFHRSGGDPTRAILLDSSAGTGKSVGTGATLVRWCLDYPGSRFLVARQTLRSLRESWQTTFEEQVLPAYGLSPGRGSKMHRQSYKIGASEIVLGGLDDPQKHYSTEWNAVLLVEGTQISEDTFERFFRALRWPKGAPFHTMVVECNPESPFHWLHQKFIAQPQPGFLRRQATYKDNPAYWDLEANDWTERGLEFSENLKAGTSGTLYRRLFLGEWCMVEGQVFDCWEPDKYVVSGECERRNDGYWWVVPDAGDPVRLNWLAAGQDWGYTSPGVVSVWGFDDWGRAWLVEEVYRTKQDDGWWTDTIAELHDKWGFWRCVTDPENAAGIAMVNRRLRAADGRPLLTTADKKTTQAGRTKYAMVMHAHTEMSNGRLMFLAGARRHERDEFLKSKPACTVEEFPSYMWAPPRESRRYEMVGGEGPALDVPIKVNDHGIDAMLYLLWAVYQKDLSPPTATVFEPRRPEHVLTRDPEYLRLMRAREG